MNGPISVAGRDLMTRAAGLRLKAPWKAGPRAHASPVLVVATRLVWARFHDLPEVIVSGLRFRELWDHMDGAVGVQTGSEPLSKAMVSISVWESNEAFDQFMSHPRHLELMNRHRGRLLTSRSTQWWADDFNLRASWAEGDRRLGSH